MCTTEELNNQIQSLLRQIAELDQQSGLGLTSNGEFRDPYREENERMERYLSEFTVRQGALLTVAGLISMLPLTSETHLKHFLIWSFPFLIIAIACYVYSSKRINFVSKETPTLLNSYEANLMLKTTYYRSSFFHKGTDIAITVFFFSSIVNYYVLTFLRDLTLFEQILIGIISLGVGAGRLWYITSSKDRFVINSAHATGSSPKYDQVPMTPYEVCDMDEQLEDDNESTSKKTPN